VLYRVEKSIILYVSVSFMSTPALARVKLIKLLLYFNAKRTLFALVLNVRAAI
jgi:hypothetical protein